MNPTLDMPSPAPVVEANGPRSRARRVLVGVARALGALLLSTGIFIGCLWLYTRYNTFPSSYHPDEPGKVTQVLSERGYRNFNHPQLLLEATLLLMRYVDPQGDAHTTVVIGRYASALTAAVGVWALAWVGFGAKGLGGMALMGAAVGLCPALLAVSHFMKEDAPLLGGLAMTVAGSYFYARANGAGWVKVFCAVLFGTGVAFACSGKYVGMIALVPAVGVLLVCSRRQWVIPSTVAFVLSLGAAYATINHRAIENFQGFLAGFEREKEHSVTDHAGLTMSRPNTFFISATLEEAAPVVQWLAAGSVVTFVLSYRRRGVWDLIMPFGLPMLFLVGLSWSVIPFNRYALPVVLGLNVLAAWCVMWLADALPAHRARWGPWVVWCGAAVLVAVQLPRCLTYLDQFAFDSRDEARNWIGANLPRSAYVVADAYARVDTDGTRLGEPPARRVAMRVQSRFFVCDTGPLEQLRSNGVTHVVVCSSAFDRFFIPEVRAVDGNVNTLIRRRLWYERLFQEGELVWRSTNRLPMNSVPANPDVRVYRIAPVR